MTMYSHFLLFYNARAVQFDLSDTFKVIIRLLRISSAFLEESLQGSVVSEHVNSGVRDTRREVTDVDQET